MRDIQQHSTKGADKWEHLNIQQAFSVFSPFILVSLLVTGCWVHVKLFMINMHTFTADDLENHDNHAHAVKSSYYVVINHTNII